MKKCLVLSAGGYLAHTIVRLAEESQYDVLYLEPKDILKSEWYVASSPDYQIQISVRGQTICFTAHDLFYEDCMSSLGAYIADHYQHASSYHQHSWQAFWWRCINCLHRCYCSSHSIFHLIFGSGQL